MRASKNDSIKKLISVAGIAATASVFLGLPALASDQFSGDRASQSNSTATTTKILTQRQQGNPATVNKSPERGTWTCLNNPNPACGNPTPLSVGTRIEKGSWLCINNPGSECRS